MKYKYRIVELNNGEFMIEVKPKKLLSFFYSWNYFGSRKSKERAEEFIDQCLSAELHRENMEKGEKRKKVIKVYGGNKG